MLTNDFRLCIISLQFKKTHADLAHPVERHLAKVEVASSSLVIRSMKKKKHFGASFFVLIRIARLEKAVAKQRNSRGLFRRPCACRRAQKRAERVS